MQMSELITHLGLQAFYLCEDSKNRDVEAVYCGDLLSDVMAHAPADSVWFSIQGHLNIIAVAQLRDIACIVLVNGVVPDPQTIEKATELGISICGSEETSANLCMKLAGML